MTADGVAAALAGAGFDPADGTLDPSTFATLLAEYGRALLGDVAASFRHEAVSALAALEAAVASASPAAAERQFHFIKGSALYLAMGNLAALCEHLENESRAGRMPGPEAVVAVRHAVADGFARLAALGFPKAG